MAEFFEYTYPMYVDDIRSIIRNNVIDLKHLHLFGVYRGGLFPATHLSNAFQIPLNIIKFQRLDGDDKKPTILYGPDQYGPDDKILVVDDIYDSGKTMQEILSYFLNRGIKRENLSLVCLFGDNNEINVDYLRKRPNMWIKFFWENV